MSYPARAEGLVNSTSIEAKIYNAQLRNRIEPKIDLGWTKMASGEIDPRPRKFWLSVEFLKIYVRKKKILTTISFVDFTKAFDSIHRGKMEQILAYALPKETVGTITMLYRNTKVKVYSPDGDTDDLDIVPGVLQGDILAPYLFIIWLDYVIRTSIAKIKENGFKLTKERSRRYPAKTITDAEDIALLANAPALTETLLHSLEGAAAGIGLHVNAHKAEYMCFNQSGNISTLNGSTLKLVDKFTYQGSSVSSTKTDINMRLAKAWTANDRL